MFRTISILITTFSILFHTIEAKKIDLGKSKEFTALSYSDSHDQGSAKPTGGKEFSRPFIEAAKKATPAVVYIRADNTPSAPSTSDPYDFFNEEFFNRFFGGGTPKKKSTEPQISQGSGFIVTSSGHIITNYHVVKGAKKITVLLHDRSNREVTATLIGGDEHTDIAVIKIDEIFGNNFPYLTFGNSDEVEVGEWVIAIGNPFQLEATVTAGIISAKGRQNLQITALEDFIQTDAAINPGNSGGPLIDLNGHVIGMNTAIVSRSGGYMGIGFAIPCNIIKNIKEQMIENGMVSRGFLGISLQDIDKDLQEAFGLDQMEGALVVDVQKDSPAEKAGIMIGDIITKSNDNPVRTRSGLRNDILLLKPDTHITLTLIRNGKVQTLSVTLGTFGQNNLASSSATFNKLGVSVDNLTNENIKRYKLSPEETGVIILEIAQGSPADRAHLKEGFIIMAIDHKKVNNVAEFKDIVSKLEKNKPVLILCRDKNQIRFYSVKID